MLTIDNKKLSTGDIISRKKLVDTYNTSNQGGITPSIENKLIFIFSDPNIGEKFGYSDGWKDGVFLTHPIFNIYRLSHKLECFYESNNLEFKFTNK